MNTLKIAELEAAINRCKHAEPFTNGVLSPDVRLMATLYGEMIFHHLECVALDGLPTPLATVLKKWKAVAVSGSGFGSAQVAQSCPLRAGVSGLEGCEACE